MRARPDILLAISFLTTQVKAADVHDWEYHELQNWTGGALNLKKCFFSIMEWKFMDDGLPY